MKIDFDDLFKDKTYLRYFIAVLAAFLFALYFYFLLFGSDRSYSRLLDLHNSYEILKKKVNELKKENAILQKKYFELKELEGPDE
jgi:cell division protein FtsB